MYKFEKALRGRDGELDAWLEDHSEEEVREAILAYVEAEKAKILVEKATHEAILTSLARIEANTKTLLSAGKAGRRVLNP